MNVDVSAVMMSVRMRRNDRLMTGEVLSAKCHAKLLYLVNSQSVIVTVTRIKTDDIVMRFDILRLVVFSVLTVCTNTRNRIIIFMASNRREPDIFTRNESAGAVGFDLLRMLVMLEHQILFRCGVVCIFRADVFDSCHRVPPLSFQNRTAPLKVPRVTF